MKPFCLERLVEECLRALGEGEAERIAKILAQQPALAREAMLMHEALAWRTTMLEPLPPPAQGRQRLLAALDSVERFRAFLSTLCQVVDLPEDAMRGLLARVDDVGAWEEGPVPGLYLTRFQPGPRLASVGAGFVRVTAGQKIPRHRHLGPEVALVLEGTLWEDGVAYLPGRLLERATGTVHGCRAGSERDLVFAITHTGVEIV